MRNTGQPALDHAPVQHVVGNDYTAPLMALGDTWRGEWIRRPRTAQWEKRVGRAGAALRATFRPIVGHRPYVNELPGAHIDSAQPLPVVHPQYIATHAEHGWLVRRHAE